MMVIIIKTHACSGACDASQLSLDRPIFGTEKRTKESKPFANYCSGFCMAHALAYQCMSHCSWNCSVSSCQQQWVERRLPVCSTTFQQFVLKLPL